MSLNVLDLCEQACVGAMPTRFSYVGCEEGADSSTTLVHINIIPPEVTDDDLRSAEDLVTFKFHSYKIMSICKPHVASIQSLCLLCGFVLLPKCAHMHLQAHGIGTQIQIPESKVSKGVITQKIQHLGLHQPLKKIVGKSSES